MIMEVLGFNSLGSIDAIIDSVHMSIPDDPANRHRQMIAEWEFDEDGKRVNTIPAYVKPTEELWNELRAKRDQLLSSSDWTQLTDVPDDPEGSTKAAWATYRQALRDLPASTSDPSAPEWPTAPDQE